MAWSWFRRRADRPPGPAPAATQRTVAGPARPQDDWQELPALQRTLHALSPVAPLDVFTTGLAAHQNPSFLAPLGHRVDPDGPGGLVNGLASVRPGHSIPYAAATALAVPAHSSEPRQTVQRHSVTWSTPTAATPADASVVVQDNAPPVEENPSSSPVPAGDPADTDVSDLVTPAAAPARQTAATALPSLLPGATTEPHSGPTDDAVQTAVPASASVDTEVVTPEPAPTTSTEGQVVPLLGEPDVVGSAAPLTAGPAPGRPVARAQPPASQGGEAGASPPTILSAASPVPILQRQLTAVPERGSRTGVLPPPFTVELPVVASPAAEPPDATGPPPDGLPGEDSSNSEPAPTVGLTAGDLTTAPSSSQEPAPNSARPTLDLPTAPAASPEPAATGEPPATDLPVARVASSPEPVRAPDPGPTTAQAEPEVVGSESAEPTAPLSGFAARIASLTNPPADPPPTVAPGPLAPPSVQRLTGPALSHNAPAPTESFEWRTVTAPAKTAPAASAGSPEPPVVPTVSMGAPVVQRSADHTADVEAGPAPVAAIRPTAASGRLEAGGSPGSDQPLPAAPVVTALTADHGGGLGPSTGGSVSTPGSATGGPTSAPSTALPVVARLTSDEPRSPASPTLAPRLSTETAALVPHRPPLAVRSDLSSAVAPPPPVQRLSFPDPSDAIPSPRSEAPAAVQRMLATPGAAELNRLADSPVTHSNSLRTVSDERPMVTGLVPTGGATRQMDPIPVQRRATGQPAAPAASPQTILAAKRSGEHASAMPETVGQVRSFATMFATASGEAAAEPEDHPGYTTVQLQTAAEPSSDTSAEEPTATPTVQRQVETAAPAPSAAAPAASPAAAPPTSGAAAADLDEMARRLFEPLSARLRAELWLDRERAGLVTDVRH